MSSKIPVIPSGTFILSSRVIACIVWFIKGIPNNIEWVLGNFRFIIDIDGFSVVNVIFYKNIANVESDYNYTTGAVIVKVTSGGN